MQITITKRKFPGLRRRIQWKLFPNSLKIGWMWYHSIFPDWFLKKIGKEFRPWKYQAEQVFCVKRIGSEDTIALKLK